MAAPPTELPWLAQAIISTLTGLGLFVGAIITYARKAKHLPQAEAGDSLVIAGAIADKASVDRLIAALDRLTEAVTHSERTIERIDHTTRSSEDRISRAADHSVQATERLTHAVAEQTDALTNLLKFIRPKT